MSGAFGGRALRHLRTVIRSLSGRLIPACPVSPWTHAAGTHPFLNPAPTQSPTPDLVDLVAALTGQYTLLRLANAPLGFFLGVARTVCACACASELWLSPYLGLTRPVHLAPCQDPHD